MKQRYWWLAVLLAAVVGLAGLYYFQFTGAHLRAQPVAEDRLARANDGEESGDMRLRVDVVTPEKGGLPRTTTQPGSVHVFEAAELFAKVSGYLKEQHVDIGDRVKQGEVLATLDVPELVEAQSRAAAEVDQARAQVSQAEAQIRAAQADFEAAQATVTQTRAEMGRSQAYAVFREKQYERVKHLFDLKSIDERLVDEKDDERQAAHAAELAAQAAIVTSQAQQVSAGAKIERAKADLVDAQAKVRVAEAALRQATVLVDYTQIVSPYDGVITKRTFHRGDFIRAPQEGGSQALLVVQRTDVLRVVVQVPDTDVPYVNPGDRAIIKIDALPGIKFEGKVSRTADSEDPLTRSMRTEIDLPNPKNLLRSGMYGQVTIELEPGSGAAMTIPSECLVGKVAAGTGAVFVARDGRAVRTQVAVGKDNGIRVEVLNGLSPTDQVIVSSQGALTDGMPVAVGPATPAEAVAR
ncbi:MAG TPA: efflux RND transporter periplasmic adaptor subunit [Pirellulales bacterium]|jgi:RND family efflux transporter MFP subunit|nr:efflux RND transporter periplasmic adaptor subunit [Pirellulales bacterium]